jgi:hypothetical protein
MHLSGLGKKSMECGKMGNPRSGAINFNCPDLAVRNLDDCQSCIFLGVKKILKQRNNYNKRAGHTLCN